MSLETCSTWTAAAEISHSGKSRDIDPVRILFITSEANNLRIGHQPVRNFETFPCLLFFFPVSIVISNKTLDQKGPVFVPQQSRGWVGVA